MDIRPIKTDDDYRWALAEVDKYFDNEPEAGSPDGDRFDVLSDLIELYESRHHPIEAVKPIEALAAFMVDTGRSQKDLGDLFGSRPRASEILSRKRALTVEMIHALNREWGVPAELLIAPYEKRAA